MSKREIERIVREDLNAKSAKGKDAKGAEYKLFAPFAHRLFVLCV